MHSYIPSVKKQNLKGSHRNWYDVWYRIIKFTLVQHYDFYLQLASSHEEGGGIDNWENFSFLCHYVPKSHITSISYSFCMMAAFAFFPFFYKYLIVMSTHTCILIISHTILNILHKYLLSHFKICIVLDLYKPTKYLVSEIRMQHVPTSVPFCSGFSLTPQQPLLVIYSGSVCQPQPAFLAVLRARGRNGDAFSFLHTVSHVPACWQKGVQME